MKRFGQEVSFLGMAAYYILLFHKEPQLLALDFGILGTAYFFGKILQIDPKTKVPAFRIVFVGQKIDGQGRKNQYHAGFKEHVRNCFGLKFSDSSLTAQTGIAANLSLEPKPLPSEPAAEPVEPFKMELQFQEKQDTGIETKESFGWAFVPVEILAFFALFESLGHLEIPDQQAFLDSPSILLFEKRLRWSNTKSRLAFFAKELQSQGLLSDQSYRYWPFICHLFVFKDRKGRLEPLDPKAISNNATRKYGLSEQDREKLRTQILQAKLSELKTKC